jgi:hypothetical protein
MKHPSLALPRSFKRKIARRELIPMDTRQKLLAKHALIVAKASVLLILAEREGHKDLAQFHCNWVNYTHSFYCLTVNRP